MAAIQKPGKAFLLIALMYSGKAALNKAMGALTREFGHVMAESDEFDFTGFSGYYGPEMGSRLMKRYVVFEKPFDRSRIADIRLFTQELEGKLGRKCEGKHQGVRRTVNIDPGYMTKDAIVLATLKEKGHKIYLGKGVFADLQALFGRNELRVFDYTFADIKANAEFFIDVRKRFLKQ